MRNKLLALILALTMVFSITAMVPVTSSAAGAEKIGDDVVKQAAELLITLNIVQGYEDGSLHLENNITRAEFAAMLARMLKGTDELNLNAGAIVNTRLSETPENIAAVKENKTASVGTPGASLTNVGASTQYKTNIDATDLADDPFSDVSEIHWAYTDIDYLRGQGIVTGYPDGSFKPDNNILYEEAIKFVVSALGYDFMAVTYGGYPEGYIKTANTLKLLKNVNGVNTTNATRQQIMVMLYNAVSADYLVLDGIKKNLNVYETGKSILKYIFNIDTVEGFVTATEDTGLYSIGAAADKGKIEIGEEEFVCANADYKQYLGYEVTAYVEYDSDEATTGKLYMMYPAGRTKKITIDAEDIISADISGSSNSIDAYVDDEETTLKLSGDPTVIYNDVAYGRNPANATFDIECGDVTLISTAGSNTFDLVYINSYVPMYVDTVKSTDKSVTGTAYANGQTLTDYKIILDEDNDEDDITVNIIKADGTKGVFKDITANSVIYLKKWSNYYTVILGGKSVTGVVGKRGTGYVNIDGTQYDEIDGSNILSAYSLNDKITIGLTKENRVFYTNKQSSYEGLNYGLIMALEYNTKKSFDPTFTFKLMDSSGKIGFYQAAENMKFTNYLGASYKYNDDGKANSKTSQQIMAYLRTSAQYASLQSNANFRAASQARPYEQIVKYTLNAEGQIKEIVTARPSSSIPDNDERENYFIVEDIDVGNTSHHINKGKIYGTPFNVASAITFNVSKSSNPEDTDYSVGKIGTGARDGGHGIVLFDVGDDGVAACVMTGNAWTRTATTAGIDVANVVIEYKQEAVIEKDGDKEDVYEIGYVNNGAYAKKYALIDRSKGYDYFNGADYNVGDIVSPLYWSQSGYWNGQYTTGVASIGGDITFTGYWPITDMIQDIMTDDASNGFHVACGSESWGNWQREDVFGKVKSVKNGSVVVSYGNAETDAVSCNISGKKAVSYDCKTGYISVVEATEVAEGDWAYMQLSNKEFKMMVIYTNVEDADLDHVQKENDRK